MSYAGVYDDVVTWWHFDYDANSDGIAQTNEIRDQVFWGTASTPSPSGAVCKYRTGPDGGPTWTNITAVSPAGGVNYGAMCVDFAPQTNAANNVYPESLQFPDYAKVGGSCTLVTRIFSRGQASSAEITTWIFNNNFNYSAYQGWLFGLRGARINTFNRSANTANIEMSNHTFLYNKWYEIAVVFTDNGSTGDSIEYYAWPEGGRLAYYKYTNASADMIRDVPLYNGAFIGGESFTEYYSTGNARKAFNGFINHFALWDRALSKEEVLEAFSYPNQAMQIGLANDSNSEFGDESVLSSTTDESDPWYTFDCTASIGDPVSITFPLNDTHIHQRNLNQLFVADVLGVSGASVAKVALVVNNTTNAFKDASADAELRWFVDGSLLVNGSNSMKLVLKNGAATSVSFDTLFLGGSWVVGDVDGNQDEFVQESTALPDDFYWFDPNWKHVERAVTTGDTNIIARFWIPEEVDGRGNFAYSTKIISQGGTNVLGTTSPHPFIIRLNDNVIHADTNGVPDGTPITIDIPYEDLLPGENTIKCQFDLENHEGGTGWLQFDYHKLEFIPYDSGTVLILL